VFSNSRPSKGLSLPAPGRDLSTSLPSISSGRNPNSLSPLLPYRLGLFVLTRDAALKPSAGELGGAINITRFDIINWNHSRHAKSESKRTLILPILFSWGNIQKYPPPFALHRHSASENIERYPCYLDLSPIARAQVSGLRNWR
jgi:hypothetical protein